MLKAFDREFADIKSEMRNCKAINSIRDIKPSLGGRPFVLYGAAKLGKAIIDICGEQGLTVDYVCDRAVTGYYGGVEVISPETLRGRFSHAAVMVCSKKYSIEIRKNLMEFGFAPDQIIPLPFEYPYCSSLRSFEAHLPGYEWAFNFFEDEPSKRLVLDMIRLILCDRGLERNTGCGLYYEDGIVPFSDSEIFVDGGAFNGDTAEEFLSKTEKLKGGRKVYSFEPDKVNFEKAAGRLSGLADVAVIQKGLWSCVDELVFKSNMAGDSSFIRASGKDEYYVPVTSLDDCFSSEPECGWPTFIKLDVEGAEKEALLGAANIIKRRKPKLAICVYHKIEDVYQLPQTISDMRDDYQFCLRQHSRGCEDTILYAV